MRWNGILGSVEKGVDNNSFSHLLGVVLRIFSHCNVSFYFLFFRKKETKKLSTKEIVASTLCSCRKNACTRSGTCLALRFTAVLGVLRTALS